MSSTNRGDLLPDPHNGPYYSRYTQHKVVFNYNNPDDQLATSPDQHFLCTGNEFHSNLFSPVSNQYPDAHFLTKASDKDSTAVLSSEHSLQSDYQHLVTRKPSADGHTYHNSTEFKALSPKFDLYDHPLSTFRSNSLESNPRQNSLDQPIKERRSNSINNHKSKGKFASILSKHSVNIFAAAAFKYAHEKVRKKDLRHSCPELISPSTKQTVIVEKTKTTKTCSYNELSTLSPDIANQQEVSGNKLKVPNIFTTSFTHSKVSSTSCSPPQPVTRYTLSLQDIPDASRKSPERVLRRTISLSKENLKIGHLLSPTMYRDEQIAQITDYLFIGSIEAAFNERRMCQLEVESIVDISNMNERQVPSCKKTQCPCLCRIELKHFRSRLIIAVADEENEGIDQYFEEVNKFVEGARRCSKKVLIYSYEGKSRAALFAIQYLMSYEGLLLRQAYNMVKKQRPQISLNPTFQKTLEKLEKTLFPDEKHSVNICNEYLNVADPQAIKCAWIDC